MKGRRKFAGFLAAALLAGAALAGGSASAAPGAITCTVSASLTLPAPQNILAPTDGTGTVSAVYVCEGGTTTGTSLAGVGTGGGAFQFCQHATHASPCSGVTDDPDPKAEMLADLLVGAGQKVTHSTGGPISITMNTGITCTHGVQGHNFLTLAHATATNFMCKSGQTTIFGPVNSTISDRLAEVVVNPLLNCPPGPLGLKACFDTVLYQGQIEAHSTT